MKTSKAFMVATVIYALASNNLLAQDDLKTDCLGVFSETFGYIYVVESKIFPYLRIITTHEAGLKEPHYVNQDVAELLSVRTAKY